MSFSISLDKIFSFVEKITRSSNGWQECAIPDWIDTSKFMWFHGGGYIYYVNGKTYRYKIITPSMHCYKKLRKSVKKNQI
jgi:hypothetical protein